MYKISKFLILAIAIVVLVIAPFLCSKAQQPSGGILNYPGSFKLFTTKFDTIRVVMLVCDTMSTSWVDSGIVNGKLVQIGEKHKRYRERSAYWMYGYSVREFIGNRIIEINNGWGGSYEEPYYEHMLYLDDRKKPLQYKIVWMAKEIN